MFTTIKTFTVPAQANGQEFTANISIEVAEDDLDPKGDFDFGDADENTKYLARFTSGELFVGVIRVTAEALGEEGTDILGGCHLHSNNAYSDKFEKDVDQLALDYGMVNNALDELIQAIETKANLLKPFIK